jgi:hypothetical protein
MENETIVMCVSIVHDKQDLVSSSTRRHVSLPLQPQQHLLEPVNVSGASTSTSDSLGLGVFEFDELADALPGCTDREGFGERLDIIGFAVPD